MADNEGTDTEAQADTQAQAQADAQADAQGSVIRRTRRKNPTRRAHPGTSRFQDPSPEIAKGRREAAAQMPEPDGPPVNKGGIVPPGGTTSNKVDPRPRSKFVRPVRMGKRWAQILTEIDAGIITWSEFVETLTPEELARGQLMDKNGTFKGRPPSMVPRAFYDASIRELMKRGRRLYEENYIEAIDAMTAIAKGEVAGIKPADRIKAAQFVIERLEGKAVERVVVTGEDPFAAMLEGAVATVEEDKAIANAQDYLDRMERVANGEDE